MNVPEINGKPAVMITVGVAEKINLGNFSNVDVGPISVTRFVEDSTDETILDEMRDTMKGLVETLLEEERKPILEMIQGKT